MGGGPSRPSHRPYTYQGFNRPDTAGLMRGEVQPGQSSGTTSRESLELTDHPAALRHGLRYGRVLPTNIESPSECTTLSTVSSLSAPALDHKYRYHLLFAHHASDRPWVEQVVRRLEQEPHTFRCCYDSRGPESGVGVGMTEAQSTLCKLALSHRVVLVLSPSFVAEVWPLYEETLSHLTSLSQRRQRLLPVILEECVVPESLRLTQAVDVSQDALCEGFYQLLLPEASSRSGSITTIRSLSSGCPVTRGLTNGQTIAHVSFKIRGYLRSYLVYNYERVFDPNVNSDAKLSQEEFEDIIRFISQERGGGGQLSSWLLSTLPSLLIGLVALLWCVAFILVINLLPDGTKYTLPVRLCVFGFPGVFIVCSFVWMWKRARYKHNQFSVAMFSRSIQVNSALYEKGQAVMVSTAQTREDNFHIYFVYFNRSNCIEDIKMVLTHCSDEDIDKLNKLVNVYTLNGRYLRKCPVAVRLVVMMSSAYVISATFRRLAETVERRHTRRRQCLCQFVETFLASYLTCVRHGSDVTSLCDAFSKYLNCQLKPDPIILQTLGIVTHG